MNDLDESKIILKKAVGAIRAGDKASGRRLLAQVLRLDPENELAWLWLAHAVDERSRRRQCLEKVLALNPGNATARRELQSLDSTYNYASSYPPSVAEGVCERCGQPLGPQLLNCPERSSGTCPYLVSSSGTIVEPRYGISAIIFGLAIGIVGAIGIDFPWFSTLFAIIFVALGIYMAWGRRVMLYNPETGQMWEQLSIFSVPVRYITTSPFTPVPSSGQISYALQYPVSVAMLTLYHQRRNRSIKAWISYAAQVFYATLLSLVAQEALELKVVTVRKGLFFFISRRMFVLVPGRKAYEAPVEGLLENRILQGVLEWSQKLLPSINFQNHVYSRKLRHCVTLHDIVLLVLRRSWSSPGRRLVSSIVGKDAAQRGLGEMGGLLNTRFKLADAGIGLLEADYAVAQSLIEQFAIQNPDVSMELQQHIIKAFKARIDKGHHKSTSRV